jgi:hypothetical protein
MEQWTVLTRDHHEAFVSWEAFERNRARLSRNSFASVPAAQIRTWWPRVADRTSSMPTMRANAARRIHGPQSQASVLLPERAAMHGIAPCISFGARRPDLAIGTEILLVVEPFAVEAALMAEREAIAQINEQHRAPRTRARAG